MEDDKNSATESSARACEQIDPILAHLKIEGLDVDIEKIRSHFDQLWEYENADSLEPREKNFTTLGLFMYTCHVVLDDYNLNTMRAREHISRAMTNWLSPEIEQQVTEEKASDNPFKTFLEKNQSRVDEFYTWEYFLLETKKAGEKEWNFKMKKCWFTQFFIRFGRADFILTACNYCQVPAEARKDYVNLKLTNTFAKLGTFCQFKYTPKTDS